MQIILGRKWLTFWQIKNQSIHKKERLFSLNQRYGWSYLCLNVHRNCFSCEQCGTSFFLNLRFWVKKNNNKQTVFFRKWQYWDGMILTYIYMKFYHQMTIPNRHVPPYLFSYIFSRYTSQNFIANCCKFTLA